MPTLRELKKRLNSIKTTEKISAAMKTVASAKLSKVSKVLESYRAYERASAMTLELFGDELSQALGQKNPDAPVCYVVMASNRGLCGGYNLELLNYADGIVNEDSEAMLITVGKYSKRHYEGRYAASFSLPDVPTGDTCGELIDYLLSLYNNGEISRLVFIYQQYKNTLVQTPVSKQLLPLEASATKGNTDMICLPDRATVVRSAAVSLVRSAMLAAFLEAASGAQAATLNAMKSACDNAKESRQKLEVKIYRSRQASVTQSVLETSVDFSENDW
jgi:F-type H+-transporting ATPase subunit gamma